MSADPSGTHTTTNGAEAYYLHGHGDNPVILRTPADMDALIDALLSQTWENRTAALHHMDHPVNALGLPGHEFHIAVDPDTGTGALRYGGIWQGKGGTWFSRGNSGKTGTILRFYMGSDNEFPADSEIPWTPSAPPSRNFSPPPANAPPLCGGNPTGPCWTSTQNSEAARERQLARYPHDDQRRGGVLPART